MQKHKTEHKCPICQQPADWTTKNVHRPFCCERCQLIDLGAWASEFYKVEEPEKSDDKKKK